MPLFDNEEAVSNLALLKYHIACFDFAIEHLFFDIFAGLKQQYS